MGSHVDSGVSEDATRRLTIALVAVFRRAPANLTPDLRLGAIDGWDSMNSLSLILELERAFDVNLGETTLRADQTIADVLTVIRDCAGATGS
jgi:acyl carrier protein